MNSGSDGAPLSRRLPLRREPRITPEPKESWFGWVVSAFAVQQLGDIVFVELPDVGASLERGTSFGSVESVKAVEDVYAPISGTVEVRNEAVLASPEEIQNDPFGEGWLLLVRPSAAAELNDLMDAARYRAKVEGG